MRGCENARRNRLLSRGKSTKIRLYSTFSDRFRTPNGIPLCVPNQLRNGEYNLILVGSTRIRKRFLRMYSEHPSLVMWTIFMNHESQHGTQLFVQLVAATVGGNQLCVKLGGWGILIEPIFSHRSNMSCPRVSRHNGGTRGASIMLSCENATVGKNGLILGNSYCNQLHEKLRKGNIRPFDM